jgi:hypothetical protein
MLRRIHFASSLPGYVCSTRCLFTFHVSRFTEQALSLIIGWVSSQREVPHFRLRLGWSGLFQILIESLELPFCETSYSPGLFPEMLPNSSLPYYFIT